MVSEKGDVQTFLALHPPFNHLSEKQLEYASSNIFVAFSKSGSELQLGTLAEERYVVGMFIVRSGSMEIRTEQNILLDRLSTGDYLVPSVLARDTENTPRIFVLEDCLYYELTASAFQTLCAGSSEMAALCDDNITRLTHSPADSATNDSQHHVAQLTKDAYLTQRVKDSMSHSVICADPKTTIREAAQLMTQHRISSLLIKHGQDLVGIVTDRDFRTRVLAVGVSDSETIKHVMTPAPMCIDVNSRLHDAQLIMMSEGVHHLPVVQDDNPVGIITPSDILRANNIEPLSLVRSVNRATDIEQLSIAAGGIPALVVRLVEHDARAIEVGKIITTLTDGITKRLLTLAEEKVWCATL